MLSISCLPASQPDELDQLMEPVVAATPAPPRAPAPAESFDALREKIRKLADQAVELNKANKPEEAQKKIDAARVAILNFEGTPEQQEQLAEEYDLLLAILDDVIEPEKRPPGEAVQFILTPLEPDENDIKNVEAARSIPSLQKYLKQLSPVSRKRVAAQLAVFTRTDRGRRLFQRYLERSANYRDYIHRVLAQYKLPAELFCVALIESGFSETAYSRTGAAGLWQFMPMTAREYGLAVDQWVDERYDWMTATDRAAQYLKNSLSHYRGDIELAVASYNTGAGNVDRAIRRAGVRDYWRLKLHPETMGYVPKWIAAMILYYSPQRYGFTLPPPAALQVESITIRGSIELEAIAKAIGQNPKDLQALNRALIRQATPPDRSWNLRLPAGSRDRLLANMDSLLQAESVVWLAHRVQPGETPGKIAKLYSMPVEQIIAANNLLDRGLPDAGEVIMIPVKPDNQQALQAQALQKQKLAQAQASSTKEPAVENAKVKESPPRRVTHRVHRRENLWSIAQAYEVSVDDLKQWNADRIGPGDQIKAGQKLVIYVGEAPAPVVNQSYTVRRGDTLAEIAKRFDIPLDQLKELNKLQGACTIQPGQVLLISGDPTVVSAPPPIVYAAKKGDTMKTVARQFKVTVQNLAAANNLPTTARLRIGQKLQIPVSPGGGKTTGASGGGWIKYKVKSGDTLEKIADRYGCTISDLEAWNKIKRSKPLQRGQVLKIKSAKK